MKTFKEFINEGVRDLMTPKSDEEIKKSSKGLSPFMKLKNGCNYNMLWLVKDAVEELKFTNNETSKNKLHYAMLSACNKGYLDIVKYLYYNGADISLINSYLYDSILDNQIEIVKFFLSKGGNPYADDIPHKTLSAIEIAKDEGYTEMLELLKDYKKN
jgi:ankyrin repeat protein